MGGRDLSKCWNLANCFSGKSKERKVRDVGEYNINDPIAKYDPQLVKEAVSKVRCYLAKHTHTHTQPCTMISPTFLARNVIY